MIWQDFHFLRPLLLLLLSIPALFLFLNAQRGNSFSNWAKICDADLLKYLLINTNDTKQKAGRFLFFTALIIGIISAAGPSFKKKEQPVLDLPNPVMFLLNLSTDMEKTDITPSRLARAKIEITDILNLLSNTQSGLIVYTDEPYLISPLSKDPKIISALFESVNQDIMPSNGDRLDRAIDLAVQRIKGAGFSFGNIIILSPEGGIDESLSLQAAKEASAKQIFVSAVSVSATPNPTLEKIARAGHGAFSKISNHSAQKIADFIKQTLSSERHEGQDMTSQWEDFGYYLMFISVLCFLSLFRRGLFIFIFCILTMQKASAGFWFSDSYQADKLFNEGKFEQASKLFKDPSWQGAALYKAGNFQNAEAAFAKSKGIESLYNKGNALAKSGKIDEAIKTYEEVLKENPDHEDAKFNLDYLKKQQEQQQKNQQSEQNNQDQKQNQDQQNQSDQDQKNTDQNKEQNQNQSQNGENSDQDLKQNKSDQDKNSDQEENSNTRQDRDPTASEKDSESAENTAGAMENDQNKPQYDEEIQARAQRLRDISEDKGGLLRAFIRKEYNKNRYGE